MFDVGENYFVTELIEGEPLRTMQVPARRAIEVLVLVPVFVSPMVLAFGYVVAMGPVGFYSLWAQELIGTIPWNVYSLFSIAAIAGLCIGGAATGIPAPDSPWG